MAVHAYLFEAKSIQPYLLESGRLRDLIGASEIVDWMTGGLLDEALAQLELTEGHQIQFSRRAGGSFYAFSADGEVLDRLAGLWSLLVQQAAPGLAFNVGRGRGDTALEAFDGARNALHADTSRMQAALPAAAPIAQRSRRTGYAAAERDKDGPMDAATVRKKRFADLSRAGLTDRFSPPQIPLSWRDWPRDLTPGAEDAFPFLGEERTVALVHADGNGLGQLLENARAAASRSPERFIEIFRRLSEGIEQATQNAARAATRDVLLPEREARGRPGPLAARPIVLGGDDLTVLVRADLALPFMRAFLTVFEAESESAMKKLEALGIADLPARLTAGAGVVYMHANQPFHLAAHLAESLMAEAKRCAKTVNPDAPPSTFVFHRVTTAMIDDYDAIVGRDKTTRDDARSYVHTLGAYALRQVDGLPALDDLLELQALMEAPDMARGPARQLLTLLGLSPDQAGMRYNRLRQRMREGNEEMRERFESFEERLAALVPGFDRDGDLPFGGHGERRISPLGDVLTLMAVGSAPGPSGSVLTEAGA